MSMRRKESLEYGTNTPKSARMLRFRENALKGLLTMPRRNWRGPWINYHKLVRMFPSICKPSKTK